MKKDNKILAVAAIIIFISFFSFNFSNITGRVTGYLPDLVGEAMFIDKNTGEEILSAKPGDSVDIKVTVINKGLADAAMEGIITKFELKKDGVKVPERGLKKNIEVTNVLKPGSSFSKRLEQFTSYKDYQFNAPGEYCFDVKVDTGKKIAETDEQNDFLSINCIAVVEEGMKLPKKEAEKAVKSKKEKVLAPTDLNIQLLEYNEKDDKTISRLLLAEETCFLTEINNICSKVVELELNKDYLVRGTTSLRDWKVEFVRIVNQDSSKEVLKKTCLAGVCDLITKDLLSPETKNNQFIAAGKYIISATAKKSK
ncbi:hypothetical protein HYX16_06360 [Candidatus Woesearchaeota archaeon]|nr:hypothetical protein [Candidatus Woesearchaeota archaeon]